MRQLYAHEFFLPHFPLHIMSVNQGPIAPHAHDFFEIVYVRRGRGVHYIEGAPYPIQSGDLYVISPGEGHYYTSLPEGDIHIINILWMPELVEETLHADATLQGAVKLLYVEPLLRRETRFAHRLHLAGSLSFRVEALIDEMLREYATAAAGSELLLRHLFCALLVLLSRAYDEQAKTRVVGRKSIDTSQAVVEKAIAYIEANHTRPLRVADVAAHTAMSASRLAHLFKSRTDRGILEYLHHYRVARICNDLLHNKDSIQEIAAAAGYTDLRFFHRVFRRYTGCNPSQFRQHFANQVK